MHQMSSIHPTNRSTSARTDASSIGSSSYLSTLQLESEDDSESHSDDLNDTKIYQQMDRRRSFLCHSDLNDIATKKKKKKKKKEEVVATTRLRKHRAPLISNQTHKCICMSTKVRERMYQLHLQQKQDQETTSATKKALKKIKALHKQKAKKLKETAQALTTCRQHVLRTAIHSLYAQWMNSAFYRWKSTTRSRLKIILGFHKLNKYQTRKSKVQAMSTWKSTIHFYTFLKLRDAEEEIEELNNKQQRVQRLNNKATADVMRLQSMLNDIVAKTRAERTLHRNNLLFRLIKTYQYIQQRFALVKWQRTTKQIQTHEHNTKVDNTKRLDCSFALWLGTIKKAKQHVRILMKAMLQRNKKSLKQYFNEWKQATTSAIVVRIQGEQQWKNTRRTFLSRAWIKRMHYRQQKRTSWIKWSRFNRHGKLQEKALVSLVSRITLLTTRQCLRKWRTSIGDLKREDLKRTWQNTAMLRLRHRNQVKKKLHLLNIWKCHVLHDCRHRNQLVHQKKQQIVKEKLTFCFQRWLDTVQTHRSQTIASVYFLRACRKRTKQWFMCQWKRKTTKTKIIKLLLQKLIVCKEMKEKNNMNGLLHSSFHTWKTDSLLEEGLEAMNEISGHLKAASLLRKWFRVYISVCVLVYIVVDCGSRQGRSFSYTCLNSLYHVQVFT